MAAVVIHINVRFIIIITVIAAALLLHMSNNNMVLSDIHPPGPDTTVMFFQCSHEKYDPSDTSYKGSVNYVLQDIMANTASSGYDYYTSSSGLEKAFAHGACNGVITAENCTGCLSFAFPKIVNGCPYAIGATLQFKDCRARYEDYPFFE